MKWAVFGELVHLSYFLWKYQMKVSIMPTLSENFNQINQTLPLLQPQTWFETNLENHICALFLLALLMQNFDNFSKNCYFLFKVALSLQKKKSFYPNNLFQAKIMQILITNSSFCEKLTSFCINKDNTKPGTNVILEIDFWSRLRL